MLNSAEIRRAFRATWLIFRGDAAGLQLLDRTLDGFWRSFAAIILVIPIDAVTMLALSRTQAVEPSVGSLFIERLPVLLADWVTFPILLALAAKPLGITQTYVSYVVARNWAAPLAAAVMSIPLILQGAGWIDETAAALLTIVGLGAVLRLHYLIVRFALQVVPGTAIGLVVIDLLISLLVLRVIG